MESPSPAEVPSLTSVYSWDTYYSTRLSGTSMLFTQRAAHDMAKALFTPVCACAGVLNDICVGGCAWQLQIPLVRSSCATLEVPAGPQSRSG